MYLRYVHDNFSVFNSFEEEGAFHLKINSLRTSFWFTVELENDCAMSFSDVHLEREEESSITIIGSHLLVSIQIKFHLSLNPVKLI